MSWDPITRIVGSLGIYTKIDFAARRVAECYSTSSIFRGYSVFMKGKDPRDAHFITSRICGICGDNHATCACYAQNMAFGIHPPAAGRVDHQPGRSGRVHVRPLSLPGQSGRRRFLRADGPRDQSARSWPEPKRRPPRTPNCTAIARSPTSCGRSIPFEGAFYLEALQMSRLTREMFCLMEGRHVHPSTLYPGGVGTVPSVQLFNDYLVRLLKYVEFMKRVVPLHDDLFDFFYEALPGYEEVGRRRILLGCWGSFNNPDVCDYRYETMSDWGRAMFVTPGVVVDGKLVTTDLVDINLGLRILLGSSFYDDWQNRETFVTHDPLGNPVDQRHPWNQTTTPKPQKRDFAGQLHLGHVAPLARQADRRNAGAGYRRRAAGPALGDGPGRQGRHRLREGDRLEREDLSAQNGQLARRRVRVEDPPLEQHAGTRSGADLLSGLCGGRGALFRREGAGRGPRRATARRRPSTRCRTTRSAADSTRRCAACCRITS